MADVTYTVLATDPATGKPRTRTITARRALSEQELNQLGSQQAEELGLAPEAVLIRRTDQAAPKSATSYKETPKASTAKTVATSLMEGAPYAGLGFIGPEVAGGSKVIAAVLRSLGAAGIGAGVGKLEGKDPTSEGLSSGLTQAALEAILGPLATVVPRIGGGKITNLEDEVAPKLMKQLKAMVPAWESLPDSHEGLSKLVSTNKGQALLSQWFGKAIAEMKEAIPEGATMTLPVEAGHALGLSDKEMVAVLPTRLAAEDFKQAAGKAAYMPTEVTVPIRSVIDNLKRVSKNPEVAEGVVGALNEALGAIESSLPKELQAIRSTYGNGASAMKTLQAINVVDPTTQRISVENLALAKNARSQEYGKAGKGFLQQYLKPDSEASKIIEGAIPEGVNPRAHGMGRLHIHPTGGVSVGGESGGEAAKSLMMSTKPSVVTYSGGFPATGVEDAVKRWLPGIIHGAPDLYEAANTALKNFHKPSPKTKQEGVTP